MTGFRLPMVRDDAAAWVPAPTTRGAGTGPATRLVIVRAAARLLLMGTITAPMALLVPTRVRGWLW